MTPLKFAQCRSMRITLTSHWKFLPKVCRSPAQSPGILAIPMSLRCPLSLDRTQPYLPRSPQQPLAQGPLLMRKNHTWRMEVSHYSTLYEYRQVELCSSLLMPELDIMKAHWHCHVTIDSLWHARKRRSAQTACSRMQKIGSVISRSVQHYSTVAPPRLSSSTLEFCFSSGHF